jgi:hypothetical protein
MIRQGVRFGGSFAFGTPLPKPEAVNCSHQFVFLPCERNHIHVTRNSYKATRVPNLEFDSFLLL